MAEISKIQNGSTTYTIKDATARSAISAMPTGYNFLNSISATSVQVTLRNQSNKALASTTLPAATTSAAGVMTSTDKSKLNGIPTKYVLSYTTAASTVNIKLVNYDTNAQVDAIGLPAATTSAAGVMTASDKNRLNLAYTNAENALSTANTAVQPYDIAQEEGSGAGDYSEATTVENGLFCYETYIPELRYFHGSTYHSRFSTIDSGSSYMVFRYWTGKNHQYMLLNYYTSEFVAVYTESNVPSFIPPLFAVSEATTSDAGLMSASDKSKLNSLPTGYKNEVGRSGTINEIYIQNQNSVTLTKVVLNPATTSYAGLMTATDKSKLDSLSTSTFKEVDLTTFVSNYLGLTSTSLSVLSIGSVFAAKRIWAKIPTCTIDGTTIHAGVYNFNIQSEVAAGKYADSIWGPIYLVATYWPIGETWGGVLVITISQSSASEGIKITNIDLYT